MSRREYEAAVRDHIIREMPSRVRRAYRFALSNLYNGPGIGNFERDTKIVKDWNDDNLTDLWYDSDAGYVTDVRPDDSEECWECGGTGSVDEATGESIDVDDTEAVDVDCPGCFATGYVPLDLSEWYHFDVSEVKRMVYGELAKYV